VWQLSGFDAMIARMRTAIIDELEVFLGLCKEVVQGQWHHHASLQQCLQHNTNAVSSLNNHTQAKLKECHTVF
jgi:hypothetical protein